MIRSFAAEHPVQILCRMLGVSRSGYYAWGRREPGRPATTEARLLGEVRRIFAESRQTYGSPRVTAALRQAGQVCNHKRVERLMRQAGLSGRARPRFRVQTTDSQHELPIAPNRLLPAPPLHRA
jgi:putative transposase